MSNVEEACNDMVREVSNRYNQLHQQAPQLNAESVFIPCVCCGQALIKAPDDYGVRTAFGYIHEETRMAECQPRYASPDFDRRVDIQGSVIWNVHEEYQRKHHS